MDASEKDSLSFESYLTRGSVHSLHPTTHLVVHRLKLVSDGLLLNNLDCNIISMPILPFRAANNRANVPLHVKRRVILIPQV